MASASDAHALKEMYSSTFYPSAAVVDPTVTLSQRHRQRILPRVDSLTRRVGRYAACRVARREYVATIRSDEGVPGATDSVVDAGYEYNGRAELKWHRDTGAPDEGSYRRVPAAHPELPGSPRLCERAPRDCH